MNNRQRGVLLPEWHTVPERNSQLLRGSTYSKLCAELLAQAEAQRYFGFKNITGDREAFLAHLQGKTFAMCVAHFSHAFVVYFGANNCTHTRSSPAPFLSFRYVGSLQDSRIAMKNYRHVFACISSPPTRCPAFFGFKVVTM